MNDKIMISRESGTDKKIVAHIQTLLNKAGFPCHIDGDFGPETEGAVRNYQLANGLHVDGIVGEKTIDKLAGTKLEEQRTVYKPPVRGKVVARTIPEKLQYALMSVGAPVTYHLEYPNGGTDPEAQTGPADPETGFCDCSGFNAWVQGFDRLQKTFKYWGGYINTDSKIYEAEKDGVWFTTIDPRDAQVGDMIVGESFMDTSGSEQHRVIGHEGTITSVSTWQELMDLPGTSFLDSIQVVHCSAHNKNLNKGKSAIWKTSGAVWKRYKKWRVVRFNAEAVLALRK